MNAGVANQARLVLRRLIVGWTLRRERGGVHRRRVALEADGIHVGAVKQARIRPSVREVARGAALGLDDGVLIDERTGGLRVALDAYGILLGGGLEALLLKGAVRIVAIRALNQSLVHFVVERHGKLRLDVGVALEAESGLGSLEQGFVARAGVNAVATDAAYIAVTVCRTLKVGVLALMAAEALCVDFFGGCLGRIEDLGHVAAALNVRAASAMASLAGDPGLAMLQGQLAVSIVGESLGLRFVAGGADFCTHKVPRRGILCLSGGCFGFCRLGYGLGPGRRSGQSGGAQYARAQHQHQTSPQPRPLARSRTNRQSRY